MHSKRNKTRLHRETGFVMYRLFYVLQKAKKLLSLRSTYGTNVCAVTAINTGISVNCINSVTGADARNGALCLASTAADAFICDFVCHLPHLLRIIKRSSLCKGTSESPSNNNIVSQKDRKGKYNFKKISVTFSAFLVDSKVQLRYNIMYLLYICYLFNRK